MEESGKILVVDDEDSMRRFFRLTLEREGYEVETAESVASALAIIREMDFDLILSDIRLEDGQGLEILEASKLQDPDTPIIMMTAYASAETAVEAMKLGAADYLSKPFNIEEVKIVIQQNIRTRNLVRENKELRAELRRTKSESEFIFKSAQMRRIVDLLDRIGRMDATVLVTGESGTGKELIMRMIHDRSPRAEAPFVSVNCGALPENLFESELFGYEKGAFTGAFKRKIGLLESARRGTLFLDEISEMPLKMQVKLLRTLQDKSIRRVGGTKEIPIDVRIVAATNRNLSEAIQEGSFREDLFYRINVIPIDIPPLRVRRGDIAPLIQFFLEKNCQQIQEPLKELTPAAREALENYHWPGNVRELENTIERIVVMTQGSRIDLEHLPQSIIEPAKSPFAPNIEIPESGLDLEAFLDDLRFKFMQASLDKTDGIQSRSCELLGMSFRSFRYYMTKAKKAGYPLNAKS